MSGAVIPQVRAIVTPAKIREVRKLVKDIYMDEKLKGYILDLVLATREPAKAGLKDLEPLIAYGASPRATLALAAGAKALAFISRRGYVTPEDVKNIALDVLRHRVILTYEAEAENLTSEDVVKRILDSVEVP